MIRSAVCRRRADPRGRQKRPADGDRRSRGTDRAGDDPRRQQAPLEQQLRPSSQNRLVATEYKIDRRVSLHFLPEDFFVLLPRLQLIEAVTAAASTS
jgi:hypothetical protein